MRGHEQWYKDLINNQEFAHALLDKVCQIQKRIDACCLEAVGAEVDILRLSGEDLGMQDRPLISPRTFRKVVKPHLKELWEDAKASLLAQNPKGKVMLHSCGSVRAFIGDLIECGIDILDPVQPAAKNMNRYELKEEFGEDICFHGNIDIQDVLPFGTKEDITAEVKDAIKALAPGGDSCWRRPTMSRGTSVPKTSSIWWTASKNTAIIPSPSTKHKNRNGHIILKEIKREEL